MGVLLSCSFEDTVEDQGSGLSAAKQWPSNLHDEKEASNRLKVTSEYPVGKKNMDLKDTNRHLEAVPTKRTKKFATTRGWSYKGRGRWRCQGRPNQKRARYFESCRFVGIEIRLKLEGYQVLYPV